MFSTGCDDSGLGRVIRRGLGRWRPWRAGVVDRLQHDILAGWQGPGLIAKVAGRTSFTAPTADSSAGANDSTSASVPSLMTTGHRRQSSQGRDAGIPGKISHAIPF